MTMTLFVQPPYPWFFENWQQFTRQVANQRLPHALLLKGVEGIGAPALAKAMAQYLLCRSPAENCSCGRCRGCELVLAGSHPDYLHLKPEEKSSVIKVAQVRALGDYVANTAQQGGRKIIVLEPAEAMNIESANALLKNLEEPAGDTVFILVGYQAARILPTIRSRTSQISLSSPSQADSIAWLERNQVANASELLKAAGGAPIKAMAWFEGNALEEYREIANSIKAVYRQESSVVDVAKKLSSYDLILVISLFQQWLQRAIRMACAGQSEDLEIVTAIAELPPKGLYRLLDATQQRLAQLYAGSNPNKALAYEELLMMMQGVQAEFARIARRA